jgi:hypothetical protein
LFPGRLDLLLAAAIEGNGELDEDPPPICGGTICKVAKCEAHTPNGTVQCLLVIQNMTIGASVLGEKTAPAMGGRGTEGFGRKAYQD